MCKILVVDLDGTLLKSDMLYESFWSAFGRNWRSPFHSAAALLGGRASLKRYLAEEAEIDVTSLPYDPKVVEYVEKWRADGGKTALVTASDEGIAQSIGAHLGIFDEVYGSDGSLNLKGENKAEFLDERFGPGGYAYMGDSHADLAVWRRANLAVSVNAGPGLAKQAEAVAPKVEHLHTHEVTARSYLKALRPHQWMKNLLVFLPMLAAHQLTGQVFWLSLLAFISFSLIASSVYVLNDLLDLAADRAHPRKRARPFASGSIPISSGTWMATGLLISGSVIAAMVGLEFFLVMVAYYALTTGYSLYLKRQLVIDICVLAGLYTTRIVAGGAATGLELSVWLLAFSMFLFLSLAAVKRQAELVDYAARGKLSATGRGYHVDDLPIISMIAVSAGYVAVLVMALYVSSPAVVQLYSYPQALWGVCAVLLFWITRTVMITHRGNMHDDPVIYAAKDPVSLLCFAIILLFIVAGSML
ncbi:UbiA family prenyltransferase [Ruegeria arenilitoris]|uniref:UbiA family prenyltransferase n=1 Tax=Ruegeria arenilitoris TaxID=1173585 RepID=UPI00147DF642|nr:UbiA family prenyltransferase [Ruegeria arenilitoris]